MYPVFNDCTITIQFRHEQYSAPCWLRVSQLAAEPSSNLGWRAEPWATFQAGCSQNRLRGRGSIEPLLSSATSSIPGDTPDFQGVFEVSTNL